VQLRLIIMFIVVSLRISFKDKLAVFNVKNNYFRIDRNIGLNQIQNAAREFRFAYD